MDLSGIIFVVLAVAWAAYLIPKALRHHDEVARTRSIDRFSTTMRVLARREPVNHRDARLVVTPPGPADEPRVPAPSQDAAEETPARTPRPAVRRAAARAAARRRRRILSFLLLVDLAVTGLAAYAIVPWWSVAIPATLTLLYLLLCRTQVRRDSAARWESELAADAAPRRRAEARGFEEFDPGEDTVAIDVALLDAVAVPTEDGGSLWDPLPMTLPTYVTKPKARRTVRTIDLSEPNTWTSGRTEEDARLVAENAPADPEQAAEAEPETRRAVGS